MREVFRRELIDSGYLHMLLKPDLANIAEKRLLEKKVTKRRVLWKAEDLEAWTTRGVGGLSCHEGALRLTAPARHEPEGAMPHYRGFSSLDAILPVDGEDWRGYNRLVCKIKPSCCGYHVPQITMRLTNDGEVKIPDIYNREGAHTINLENYEWNECIWEFPDLPRDKVTEVYFRLFGYGKERFCADDFIMDICDFYLEQAEDPDIVLGWQGNAGTISFSTTGYWAKGRKFAVAQKMTGTFELLEETAGKVVFSGEMEPLNNEKGRFGVMDFSRFQVPGRYRLRAGDVVTESFALDEKVMEEAAWKVLNYIYSERCGYPVGRGHSSCHADIIAEHNGLIMPYNGGWHDAGDLSQQTLQTGEVVQALFELAACVKDDDPLLYRRLVEEARWGLDFVIRTRFGDGVRAFSAGIARWTNGMIGDADDEVVRCHNRSLDNWILSGVQAYAGHMLKEEDPDLAWVAVHTAKEDYGFALARYEEVGMETKVRMEHTHNASRSQYYAAACWAASLIYQACGEEYYAEEAERFGDLMLKCQDSGDAGLPFAGFFYRDETKDHIVHFNHQAREHIFPQAIHALCVTQKENVKLPVWEGALRSYGEYIKAIHAHAEPYGMIPAGVHGFNEPEDEETFRLLHLEADYAAEKPNYYSQLEAGVPIGEKHCIRHFPVWFSFKGNSAVLLSEGKGASVCGRYFDDPELIEIARDQLYWIAGRNPFRQSLIYGEGSNYAQQYAALCGETVGEIPVGIQTSGNGDEPFWPMANCATYKEIWMTSAGHWIRLLADIYK